ncbi:2-dehydropantoate 2-reductase [Corynebacterium sp. NML 150383]|uniref:2-dehydropantoate 2-reductase n=1 Tax=Corynebacterium sp. NML 150383 TaxID=2029400 RepID=UPI000BAA48C8|nr:2-dehydropantoate 2-reductase [Corynebacterium sp. NML 150383]PAT03962.1 2-dehydropantoate 2-reductase [Corynebacterium sp. NML 150383]
MKVVCIGAGAIGGYFGGVLAEAGHEVSFVARGETLAALRQRGVLLSRGDEPARAVRVHAAEHAGEAADLMGGADIVVVATKALPDNPTFADLADARQLGGVPIVTTQNSVEIHDTAARIFGADRVLAGVARCYATRVGPAEIVLNPGPLALSFGPVAGASISETARAFRAALDEAGIGGELYAPGDVLTDVWSKAMFVTTTGALGAVAGVPMGVLRDALRPQLRALMKEVEAAARGLGVRLPADAVSQTLAFADQQYAGATSSMQRDIADGLPSELDAQVGAIRRQAAAAGVPTPLLDYTYAVLAVRA